MSRDWFDVPEHHLLTHAAAMDGRLSTGNLHASDGNGADLIAAGLAEWVSKDGRTCWQLTAAGRATAASLGGAR
jgi:hypothetical protein